MKAATALNCLGAVVFAATFFAIHHHAEQADDIGQRAAAVNAQMDAADARLQRAAAALCKAELGPGAQVLWTSEGDLVCRPAVLTASNESRAE